MQVRPFFLCSKHSQIASFLSFQDENPLLSLEFLMQPELQGLKNSLALEHYWTQGNKGRMGVGMGVVELGFF